MNESVTVTIIDEIRLGFLYLGALLCIISSISLYLVKPSEVSFIYSFGILFTGVGLFVYTLYKSDKMEISRALLFAKERAEQEAMDNIGAMVSEMEDVRVKK